MIHKNISRFLIVSLSVCMLLSTTACSNHKADSSNHETSITEVSTGEKIINIQDLVDSVSQSTLADHVAKLSGETQISIGAKTTTLTNRITGTESYELAAQYVYEFLENLGLEVTYQSGITEESITDQMTMTYPYKNVIAEKKGITYPDQVVVLCAHLDSTAMGMSRVDAALSEGNAVSPIDPSAVETDSGESASNMEAESFDSDVSDMGKESSSMIEYAPGADDNATGCAAVLHIAELLSRYEFERTIRFCFFDAEEEGFIGSTAYVESLGDTVDAIKAVINLDTLGWDSDGEPNFSIVTQFDHAETYEAQQEISQVFQQAIQNYGLSEAVTLKNITASLELLSDQVSFWNAGVPAVLVIEDTEDLNPNANMTEDVFKNLNLEYYVNVVKAITGAVADLAEHTFLQ